MPNTAPHWLKKGMTGSPAARTPSRATSSSARTIFEAVGRAVVVDEKHMDASPALGERPGFIYIIIESLAEVGQGRAPARLATELAAQTVPRRGARHARTIGLLISIDQLRVVRRIRSTDPAALLRVIDVAVCR